VPARRAATLISLQTAEDVLVMTSLAALCLTLSGFQLIEFLGRQPGLINEIEADLALLAGIVGGLLALAVAVAAALAAGLMGAGPRARTAALFARVRDFGGHVVNDWLGVMRRGKGMALANLALALAQWLARFSIAGIVLAAFGQEWHPALYWLLQYIVQSISSVVPTPGGAGGAEAAFLLLFAPFVAASVLVAAMSTWRLIFFYLPLVGAALVFFLLQRAVRLRSAALDPGAAVLPQPAE
jgi:uncharacterized membrane protein YbhN (UPF0104 family)